MKRINYFSAAFALATTLALMSGCSSGGGGSTSGTPSTDTTPPLVKLISPPNNSVNVPVDSILSATFSEPMDSTSFTSANFRINGAPADVSFKCLSAFLDPIGNLSSHTTYTLTISGVKDSAGNTLAIPYTGVFSTGSSSATITAIAASGRHAVALTSEGILWAWGFNYYGQLGDGTTTNISLPIQIGASSDWSAIAAGGNHTVALKSDGTLWAWGFNSSGQLGDGTVIDKTEPTQIGIDTNWSAIVATSGSTFALKTDGTLWAWGQNDYNQLGDGTTVNRASPTKIGTAEWRTIAAARKATFGIRTDGTLWSWGKTDYGQLGDGSTYSTRTTPAQIGLDADWSAVASGGHHAAALKTNGTLWAWGYNYTGQLGDETTIDKASPIQIGTATDWSAVKGGTLHTVALKSDGTLWAWGRNAYGTLGDGTTAEKITRTRVGTEANWSAGFAATEEHSFAIKTGGTLWAWGYNFDGQLGDGTRTHRSTPVRINTSSTAIAPAPSNVTAAAGNGQITVSWSEVAAATSYDIYYAASPSVDTASGTKIACVTSPHMITGLTPGAVYSVIVVASNGYGDSIASSAASATPTGDFSLAITKAGTGSGTVTSSPAGINCGGTCTESFAANSSVTLTATPAAGSFFAGWSGACTGTGSCLLAMSAARMVTATFNAAGPAPASCFTTTGNICMSVSPPIIITCSDIPPGFLMACSATVPMNITTPITTGVISVAVATGGADYIETTINVTPNTAPGLITAQIPLTSGLLAGCTSGYQTQYVEVYDGDFRTGTNPGGRQLFVSSVQANMICTH